MHHSNILEVKNLKVQFTSHNQITEAVKGLSFDLKKGETLGIVGESGSGKSTLSLAIMGLLPTAGKVVNGEILFTANQDTPTNLTSLSNRQISKIRGKEIAMIFQEPMSALNPVFKCGNQVLEAILCHESISLKKAKEKVFALFEQVNLHDPDRIFISYPHQLSGGQLQRVMIAMALACNPSILIADEPTSALDVTIQKSILQLLNEIKTSWGGSIIFISHDLSVVSSIADNVLVMKEGEIVERGSAKSIFHSPKQPYTIGLIKDSKLQNLTQKTFKPSSNPILEIIGLTKEFEIKKSLFARPSSTTTALDDVSINIFEGETLGLVGESGSGKSTLGKTLLRLHHPTDGSVFYQGGNLYDLDNKGWKLVRQQLQIIFQDPYSSLNPKMTIGEAIIEPMKVHGLTNNKKESTELALALMEKVGLEEHHFYRFPKEFSGGQRQRICIARALASQPKFLICDECVSALDVTVQAKIIALLQNLQEEFNLTYLFISHDLNLVKQIADRIAVMKDGKIIEIDHPQKLFENPQHSYTRQLISAIPDMY